MLMDQRVHLGGDPDHTEVEKYIPTGLGMPQDLPGGAGDLNAEEVWAFSAQSAGIVAGCKISDKKLIDGTKLVGKKWLIHWILYQWREAKVQCRVSYISSFIRPKLKWRKVTFKPSYCHYVFLSVSPTLSLFISTLCKHTAVLVSHPVSWVPRQMLLLHSTFSPSSLGQVFAFCLGLRYAAKAGQSRCMNGAWTSQHHPQSVETEVFCIVFQPTDLHHLSLISFIFVYQWFHLLVTWKSSGSQASF